MAETKAIPAANMDTTTKQGMGDRTITSKGRRAEVLARYEASGLTQKAYANREGVNYHTFVSWLVRKRREHATSTTSMASVRFAEVPAFRATPTGRLEVMLPGEIVVRGDDPAAVANLIQAIRM